MISGPNGHLRPNLTKLKTKLTPLKVNLALSAFSCISQLPSASGVKSNVHFATELWDIMVTCRSLGVSFRFLNVNCARFYEELHWSVHITKINSPPCENDYNESPISAIIVCTLSDHFI